MRGARHRDHTRLSPARARPRRADRGGRRTALQRARAGIASLWVAGLGHPGRPLAPPLGVSPQAVYQAVARGPETRAEWEGLLKR